LKKILVVAAALVIVVPATVALGGSGRDRATGGGQILLGKGAGSTITFTAQQIAAGDPAAKGEVQYIDRAAGTGKAQVRQHGDVFCIVTMGNMAEIAYVDKGEDASDPNTDVDQLYVVDNGEPNQGQDIVFIDEDPQTPCEFNDNDDDDGDTALGRGNAQVYDAG
jgi:hypothetical protein